MVQPQNIEDINFALQVLKLIALDFNPVCSVFNAYETLIETEYNIENEER